jgi:transcriptional regulator with GAF, ATPase, and Fis domain/tetratricopeptide (TPR) repeat protein
MEGLKRRKIVHEEKESGPGFYYLSDTFRASQEGASRSLPMPEEKDILARVLRHYQKTLKKTPEKNLVLAELHRKMGDSADGFRYMTEAANQLFRDGRIDEAAPYVERILEHLATEEPRKTYQETFWDDLLEKVWKTIRVIPADSRDSLLSKAASAAEHLDRRDVLARVKLEMGQLWKEAGEHEKALRCLEESWAVTQQLNDPPLSRLVTLSASNFFFIEGRIADAIMWYEKLVGKLGEVGDDETSLMAASTLGWCYVLCGHVSRGMGMMATVRAKAESLGFPDIVARCDLRKALSFLELQKLDQAWENLKPVLDRPEKEVDSRILQAAYTARAFIHTAREEYEEAILWRDRAIDLKNRLGGVSPRGPHALEYLYRLEEKGYTHEDLSLDDEIVRILGQTTDIYMKGIAYRYRALRNIKNRETRGRAFLDLKNSLKHLKLAGAEMELARTRIIMGDAFLKEGEMKAAVAYLQDAWSLLSHIDSDLFPKDLTVVVASPEGKTAAMIDLLIRANESLGGAGDMPTFLERVVNAAMDFTMAMRGAFFVMKDGEPRIMGSRNLDPMLIRREEFATILRIVSETARSERELVMPGFTERGGLTEHDVMKARIGSLACIPASLAGNTHGYLYLDNWFGVSSLPDDHLPYLRLLCKQIAVGFSHIALLEEAQELKDRFQGEAAFYRKEMGLEDPGKEIIGQSHAILAVINQIRQVAPTDSAVLITGETGVGKELVAKAIHNGSRRKDGPFIPVNLAALPHDLVASELFGHEKGAFTGAHERHKGRFELADGGTIFLDEIGDLPLSMQVKLLRVLQEGVVERLGGSSPIKPDFRLVAATNKDLLAEVARGAFRQDLYFRLNVFPIPVPSLRERREDIPLLATWFANRLARKMGRTPPRLHNDELRKLSDYDWPGNVRELQHLVERSIVVSSGRELHLPPPAQVFGRALTESAELLPLADVERHYIEKVLNATRWRVSGPKGAAAILKMKPTTLIYRMEKLGITKPLKPREAAQEP